MKIDPVVHLVQRSDTSCVVDNAGKNDSTVAVVLFLNKHVFCFPNFHKTL